MGTSVFYRWSKDFVIMWSRTYQFTVPMKCSIWDQHHLQADWEWIGFYPKYNNVYTSYTKLASSSSNCDLVVSRTSRKIGDRAFSVAAPHAWNRLPTDLKLLHSTASFKSKLKSFLFHAAYTENTVWTLECAVGLIVGGALQVTVVTVTVILNTLVTIEYWRNMWWGSIESIDAGCR